MGKINKMLSKKIFKHVIVTQLINNMDSPFRKQMNWTGCSKKDEISLETASDLDCTLIVKDTYSIDVTSLVRFGHIISKNDTIFICGFDTDACVMSCAFDFFNRGIRVVLLEDYCFSSGGIDFHEAGLMCLKRSLGTNNILKGEVKNSRGLSCL